MDKFLSGFGMSGTVGSAITNKQETKRRSSIGDSPSQNGTFVPPGTGKVSVRVGFLKCVIH